MYLDQLLDPGIERFSFELFACEPLFERGGRNMFHLMFFGNFESGVEHGNHCILILGVKRIGPAYHHNEMNFEPESFESFK